MPFGTAPGCARRSGACVLAKLELRPPHETALEDNLLLMDTLKCGSNELRSGSMTLRNPICRGSPFRVYCT